MDEQATMEQLKQEGFTEVYVWEDPGGAQYPEHAHEKQGVHIILKGTMELTDKRGKVTKLKPGDRLVIPAGTVHKASIGPEGCRYIVGEK